MTLGPLNFFFKAVVVTATSNSLFIFYWGIVALQCSVSFFCTVKWISHVCTYTPPSGTSLASPSHPSRSSQSTELSSLCSTAASHWLSVLHMVPEAPILWQPDVNSQLIEKDSDAGKDWKQKEKRVAENEMVGWRLWFNGHELGQTPEDGGQGGLTCYSPLGSQRGSHDLVRNNKQPFIHVNATLSACPPSPHPDAHKSISYICVSISALQISSSVAFF